MSLFSQLLGIATLMAIIAAVFYVIFGQVTVRKLRKNPKTKDALGVEFASGWDILNVAGALARPRWLNQKLSKSSLSFISANANLLAEHTTAFDKMLARIFYVLYIFSGSALLLLVALNALGVFD